MFCRPKSVFSIRLPAYTYQGIIEGTMYIDQAFIDKAKATREAFLKPYREKFEAAINSKAKAAVIVELIEIEPSHLSEPWIVNETIGWLRDCYECKNYIEDVFVKAPKRRAPTEKQRINNVKAFYLRSDIDRIIGKHNCSVRKACSILMNELGDAGKGDYMGWDLTDASLDVESAIRDFYNRTKDNVKKIFPPYPYYGRDILETDGKFKFFGG